ncbi:clan AA aspartic protease [Pedobacter punctiformis]|uniref:Clan AA aspartic protease n=1 Tax=Pedobacter punctiformis TaxID=3004097 RepID=A0ABT4LA79_9SPHI|nr:clan AA aspartic protease [Pedobacter sp. HCMS5-2]MCZ4244842.1 clan AA aspartic protease [Pedobacter sp. HCMS5-2]
MIKNLFIAFILLSTHAIAQNKPLESDTIPLIINKQNTIYVKAVFNDSDTLNLNFDTGTTELVLTNNVLKNKLKSVPKLYNTVYNLKIGNHDYKTKIYDAELTGHDTDGRFGWDLFKDKTVELNYDKNALIVHNQLPAYVSKDSKFKKFPIKYFKELFLIEGTISQNGIKNTSLFLFDTGYQRTAMLDNDLLKLSNFPAEKMEVIKKVMMKGAQGNEIPVITSNLELLKIGNYKLKNVPVQQITANKPMRGENIHILGNEILKRFNTFLDFQNNVVYLKPNQLFNAEYVEKMKNGI